MHRTLSLEDIFSKPFEEAGLVLIVLKDRRFVYPPDDNVMQSSGYIKVGLSRHGVILLERSARVKRKA
jgi:hypothetical protein